MRLLLARSLRAKLSLLTCIVAFTAVTMACLGFAGLGFHQLCISQSQQLQNHARLLGHYSGSIFTLRDRLEGERLLASLASDPAIEAACLFDLDGNAISRYGKASSMTFPFHLQGKPSRLASLNRLETLSQIDMAGQQIGFIYLRSNTSAAQARLGQFVRGAGLISLVALGLSYVIAIPFRRAISKPILQLTKTLDDLAFSNRPAINVAGQFSPECLRVLNAVDQLIARITKSAQAAERAAMGQEDRVAENKYGLVQELKRLHKRHHDLELAKDAVEAASLAKCQLVADRSREMRASLDQIVDEVQSLLGDERSTGGQEAATRLEAIRRHGLQIQELVQEISEAASVEAGNVAMAPVECFPQTVIAGVVDEYQSLADSRTIALEYLWRGSDKESMYCAPEHLRQVVQTLVDNAIRFTEIGGVRIVARFEPAAVGRHLRIEVTDTGVGIDAEDINRVFDPADPPNGVSRDNGDSVRGLHHCRKLVAAMKGDITVSSAVGEGSVFTVIVNAEVMPPSNSKASSGERGDSCGAAIPAPATSRHSGAAAFGQARQMQPARILVVDDSDTNRDLTQLMLRRAGARVEGADNGLEAVQAAVRDSFDLILMDMQMPVMDGYSATREIRAQGIDVPIIALTAYAMDFDEKKCRGAGCSGHLTKPIDADDLLSAVERVLPQGKALTRAVRSTTKPAIAAAPATRPASPYDFDLEPQAIE